MTVLDFDNPRTVVLNGLKEMTHFNVMSVEIWENHKVRLVFKFTDDLTFENITNIKVK